MTDSAAPDPTVTSQANPEAEPAPDEAILAARMKSENARLRGELRQALARAERAERSVERMQNSAKYAIGSLLVQAAKHPLRLFLLPRDLWRIYRLRRHRRRDRSEPTPLPLQRARRDELLDLEAARLLLPRIAAAPHAQLSIAGAISRETATAWAPYAAVTRVLPHDAAEVVTDVDPDVVIIDSAAARPGEDWAYLGDPAAADRELAAVRLIDAAHERGRPVVLLRSTPPSHTTFLAPLAARCDLVLDAPGSRAEDPWHPGIDPAAWIAQSGSGGVAILGGATRSASGWQVGTTSPTERAYQQALAELVDTRNVVLPDPAREGAARSALQGATAAACLPLTLGTGFVGAQASKLGVLAAGVPLVSGPDTMLESLASAGLGIASSPAEMSEALDRAVSSLDAVGHRANLRSIVSRMGAPVCLGELAGRLHLAARPRAAWDVTLVVSGALDVGAIVAQTWRPAEIITASRVDSVARAALQGTRVVVLEGMDLSSRAVQCAAASSPYVVSDVDLSSTEAILDLLIDALRHPDSSQGDRGSAATALGAEKT